MNFIVIVSAYVVSFAVTSLIITPVQNTYMAHIGIFASVAFLPHGIRVLATMFLGWKAIAPLIVGSFLADLLFTPNYISEVIDPRLLESILVGAVSAFLTFEAFKLFGKNFYVSEGRIIHWKQVLLIGAIASIINSIGQSIVYSEFFPIHHDGLAVPLTYMLGDFVGLVITMFALMLIFRWIRLARNSTKIR